AGLNRRYPHGFAAQARNACDPLFCNKREWQPVHVAADDSKIASRFIVEDDMLGHSESELDSAVAQAICYLVNGFIEFDIDIKSFIAEMTRMLCYPYGHVKVVSRYGGEFKLVHGAALRRVRGVFYQ